MASLGRAASFGVPVPLVWYHTTPERHAAWSFVDANGRHTRTTFCWAANHDTQAWWPCANVQHKPPDSSVQPGSARQSRERERDRERDRERERQGERETEGERGGEGEGERGREGEKDVL